MAITTGDSRADSVLADVVASLHGAIGANLMSIYVAGSYAERDAVPLSDLDVIAVLEERTDQELARRIANECIARSPLRLDLVALTAPAIEERFVALVPAFKRATLLVYGVDVREQVTLPSVDVFAAAWAERARSLMFRIRHLAVAEPPLE